MIGGGDSAAEEAVYLTKFGSQVNLLVRGETMRASKAMQDRVLNNPKVTIHWNTVVDDVYGDEMLEGLKVHNVKTGESGDLPVRGLFLRDWAPAKYPAVWRTARSRRCGLHQNRAWIGGNEY